MVVRNAPRFVAYLRVSTDQQGRSGLGLGAQRLLVGRHAAGVGGRILAELVEVESGRKKDRPQLGAALAACRKHRAVLLIAKLDRLARNVAFISKLMDSGVEFIVADMPTVNRLTLHILAAVAEEEARMISARTTAALAAAKERRKRDNKPPLGGYRMNAGDVRPYAAKGGAASGAVRRERAAARAPDLAPLIDCLRASGATTLHEIAAGLNQQGIGATRGGKWSAVQVSRVLALVGAA